MTAEPKQQKPQSTTLYPELLANPDFPAMERDILGYWKKVQAFPASVDARPAKLSGKNNEYIFYDGPPFANGLPHYGHLLTGFVKDLFARYHTMKGERVERRFGWDCHGLPAEMAAEKDLGVSGRANIEKFGIQKFNDYCRTSVMKYAGEWEDYVTRQARWVDFGNDYKTMNTDYMESVMWAFKQLHEKGLVYESHRVMPYSWAMETPVSNFETRMDNAYREREDKAITVAFKLKEKPGVLKNAKEDVYILAWTTTPWTLPSNLALAVSEKLGYWGNYNDERNRWEISSQHFSKGKTDGEDRYDHPSAVIEGSDLIGLHYEPLFPYFAAAATAPIVTQKDAVVETERTYLRPFREDDYKAFHAMLTDPKVYETTSDGLLPDDVIRREFDRFMADNAKKGFSQWAVIRKENGTFMGRAGWDNRDYDQFNTSGKSAVELRYAYRSEFWNQGYAGEVATALLHWATFNMEAELFIAGCNPAYDPAVKLLKKLGFTSHNVVQFRNQGVLYHTLEKSAWRQKQRLQPNAFKIIAGDFIEEGSGTGVVHIAPGFGEDDQRVAAENGIDIVCPVDSAGHYTDEIFDVPGLSLKGMNVIADTRKSADEPYKENQLAQFGLANLRIIRNLKDRGQLVKEEQYKHNYPHCWRTDTPLIYRALPSWYVEVSKFAPRMVELNEQINWIPDHIKHGRFGKWLEGARDWSISRNRYWGSPIPVWKTESGKVKVFGSIAELKEFFGVEVKDLHRPFIDTLIKTDADGTWKRVTDVFDCWFESGSMPYAQVHYPFENKEWFETHCPADFIVEYEAQTRGWFYTMMVLSTALFDKPPFKNCICHGVVLDDKGQKLSKRLNNYADPKELFEQYGADALRWFMMSSPVMRGAEMYIDKEGKFIRDAVRLYIRPIWNAYNFFTLYANADGIKAELDYSSANVMDRYILSKLAYAVRGVEKALDAYDTPSATQAISEFFEVLNNWYIRRNKERFWKAEHDADKQAAYNTLYTVLHAMCRAAAPLLPLTTEEIYLGLTTNGAKKSATESVHLAAFPSAELASYKIDDVLMRDMGYMQDVCNAALSIRNEMKIRVRQPLSYIKVYTKDNAMLARWKSAYGDLVGDIIREEINAKDLVIGDMDFDAMTNKVLKVNASVLAKRIPQKMKQIFPAAKNGEWKLLGDGNVEICGEVITPDEYELQIEPKEKQGSAVLSSKDALVVLDLVVTPELEAEGVARDVVRMIQQARKDANLNVADRINLTLDVQDLVAKAIQTHQDYIKEQTLSVSIAMGDVSKCMHHVKQTLDDIELGIGFTVAK